jgi:hypothetical protein
MTAPGRGELFRFKLCSRHARRNLPAQVEEDLVRRGRRLHRPDPDDHFSFIRVYRQKAISDPAKAWLWIVTIRGERVASGHEADGPDGARAAVRGREGVGRVEGEGKLINPARHARRTPASHAPLTRI